VTLRDHLLEIRNRFFLVFGIFIIASTIAYFFRDPLIAGLLSPLDGRQLQYLTPGGGFKFIFSVVVFTGVAVIIPLFIQQLYAFLSPILSDKVRSRSGWLLFWSMILLVCGVAFGYIYAVPGALNFLYGFADDFIISALTADSYLDFVIKYTLGLGIMFQIPLIMIIIHWIKPQKPLKLLKFERWVILIAFILAAVITPTPDPVNQTIIAIPIIAVYQIGLIAICIAIWKENRSNNRQILAKEKIISNVKTAHNTEHLSKPTVIASPTKNKSSTPANSIKVHQPATVNARRRSIDGMLVCPSTVRISPRTTAPSSINIPTRPTPTTPSRAPRINYDRPLSIDGITVRTVSAA